jgi:hypothetical protein
MGLSNESGQFTLRTESQQDGAIPGRYRVIVEDMAIYKAPRSPDGTVTAMPPVRFPSRYTDPLRTPLQATVTAEEQQQITLPLRSR